jgi:hypothetical protein
MPMPSAAASCSTWLLDTGVPSGLSTSICSTADGKQDGFRVQAAEAVAAATAAAATAAQRGCWTPVSRQA